MWKSFEDELAQAAKDDVQFSDRDYMQLIVQLLSVGQKEAANAIIDAGLPKRRGYFQEIRNAIPAMVFTDELEIPLRILQEFRYVISNQAVMEYSVLALTS